MKLKFIEEFKNYKTTDKIIFVFAMLVAAALVFYHGFIHTGIVKLPAAKARDCNGIIGKTHQIDIKDGAFTPSNLEVHVCDTLRFTNQEDILHEPAVGPHPTHTSYPGFDANKPLLKNESFVFVVNRPGKFTFHDHLNDTIKGSVKILKEPRPVEQFAIPNDWKQYENAYYKIAYPSGWFDLDSTSSLQGALSEYNISPKEPDYDEPGYLLQIVVTEGNLSSALDKMADKDKAQDVRLNGHPAKLLALDFATIYLLEKDGKVFQVNYLYSDMLGITREEADQTLSTFSLK